MATSKGIIYPNNYGEIADIPEAMQEMAESIDKIFVNEDNKIENKVDKISGKGLSTNDFTNQDKEKLNSLSNYDDTEIKQDIADIKDDIIDLDNDKANKTEIPDVSKFITNTVDNLVNYYKKSETYTQEEVNNLIGSIQQFHYEIVQVLPQIGLTNIMYLVPKITSGTQNVYDEYVYANNNWEKIGNTEIDLSNYYTKAEVNTLISNIDLSNYYTKAQVDNLLANIDLSNYYTKTQADNLLNTKQDNLVSGINIKTVNNQSILGNGNIEIQGSGGNEIFIGDEADAPETTKLLIDDDYVDFVATPENTYSTEEQKVGTWIDGKPLYRKVLTGIGSDNTNILTGFTHNLISAKTIIKSAGYYQTGTTLKNEYEASNYCSVYGYIGSGNLKIYGRINNLQENFEYIVILEYTKSTDQGGAN